MSTAIRKRARAGRAGAVDLDALAEQLHRGAIHLLRALKTVDAETGISPPRLSALSVLVFGGPQSLKSLAAAEGVKPPTMSKLAAELETAGLVAKREDADDRRGLRIEATAKGRKVMLEGRARRLALLKLSLAALGPEDREALARAAPVLAKLGR
jgi:DNA-binding MarR family transcriptional regulator